MEKQFKTAIEGIQQLAEDHVDWLLELIRPLLIAQFVHGYKHGKKEAK